MVYLLKNKHEVAETIKEYALQVEAKWNSKISRIKSDNGREYVDNNLLAWAKAREIEINFTIPYSPQMNGTAERMNRTLMEKARALLTDSKLERKMWGEAIFTATYLLNRRSTKMLSETPYEMWKGDKPNLRNLKLFGCTAYAKILGPLKKLDERSKKLKFVGYAPQEYRLWDTEKHKIIVARDVRFENEVEATEESNKNQLKYIEGENEERDNNEQEEERDEEDEIEEEDLDKENNLNSEEDQIDLTQETDLEKNSDYEDAENEEPDEQDIEEIKQTVRRSDRERKPPKRYGDYILLTYQQAVTGPDRENWKQAIQQEKTSLKRINTWKVVNKAEARDNKILSSKWIFKEKDNGQKKAKLVIRGCEQNYGIDFEEVFSPVVNSCSLRILFALAAKRNYQILSQHST